jgi:hypothetical protein
MYSKFRSSKNKRGTQMDIIMTPTTEEVRNLTIDTSVDDDAVLESVKAYLLSDYIPDTEEEVTELGDLTENLRPDIHKRLQEYLIEYFGLDDQ